MSYIVADQIVIGGGLSGLVASYCLAQAGCKVILVDRSLDNANNSLGGFTSFSGAKFSLLPAGQGLVQVAGSIERLQQAMSKVLNLCNINVPENIIFSGPDKDIPIGNHTDIRKYHSIVLTPSQIETAVNSISQTVRGVVNVIDDIIISIEREKSQWRVNGTNNNIMYSHSIVYAGGRTGSSLLQNAGVSSQEGKGLDVGIRLEFLNKNGLRSLRGMGPDAKILKSKTRTFCLNYPGTIYRYPFKDVSIPGGIVANRSHPSANVGLLTRLSGKRTALEAILCYLRATSRSAYEEAKVVKGAPFQDKMNMIQSAYGPIVAEQLRDFAEMLGTEGLVDWSYEHKIHFPLLDWHWDVFSVGSTHRTNQPGLYVAGDTAGHARGLLQAGASGWLAAQELLADASI